MREPRAGQLDLLGTRASVEIVSREIGALHVCPIKKIKIRFLQNTSGSVVVEKRMNI